MSGARARALCLAAAVADGRVRARSGRLGDRVDGRRLAVFARSRRRLSVRRRFVFFSRCLAAALLSWLATLSASLAFAKRVVEQVRLVGVLARALTRARQQVARGLVYLHTSELIHRDLVSGRARARARGGARVPDVGVLRWRQSSNNILLDAAATAAAPVVECRVKIADFGLSISKSESATQSAG